MGVVLNDLSKLSQAQMLQLLLDAQKKITDLESRPARKVWFKVTEPKRREDGSMSAGGAVSAYGLGQFPTTLYHSQWLQLISSLPELEAFLKANASKLTSKPSKG